MFYQQKVAQNQQTSNVRDTED